MGVYAPELLILYALDMFLVLSIITCMFDSHFPVAVPYFFQLLSIAGTGHMYVSRFYEGMFTVESRFLYSVFYLGAFMTSSFAVSAYLFLAKNRAKGLMFLGGFSLPSTLFGVYIVTVFRNELPIPWLLSSGFFASWLPVMLLLSFTILFAGVSMFFDPGSAKLPSMRKLIQRLLQRLEGEDVEDVEDVEEEEEEEEEAYYEALDEFNPVDFVHVTRLEEHDEVDSDRGL
jgi:hypothetical protein